MAKILGISAFYHDSAAAIIEDGNILAAVQEERFSRCKNDARFPIEAITYCLTQSKSEVSDLDAIVFYDNPLLTLDRVLHNNACFTPDKHYQKESLRDLLGSKIWIESIIQEKLGSLGKLGRLLLCSHHMSHAASAFYPSPFDEAAVLTIDGVGEWATTTLGIGSGSNIDLIEEIRYPHSLGLLYSAFTYYCGFKVNSGEYKLMGLAPYGAPRFADLIQSDFIQLYDDGSFALNLDLFAFTQNLHLFNEHFCQRLGQPKREAETELTQHYADVAASIQYITEKAILNLARRAQTITDKKHLVLAGGVALNCVANGKVIKEKLFDDIWIQPAAGDAGGALGAALAVHYQHFQNKRILKPEASIDQQEHSLLGPAFTEDRIQHILDQNNLKYKRFTSATERAQTIAQWIADGKHIGHFKGRSEFGPRALGNRSILGDARSEKTQSTLNLKVKKRESFRPFAPIMLAEELERFFDPAQLSPYMLTVSWLRPEKRAAIPQSSERKNLEAQVNDIRSELPAITHLDYSARLQTVSAESNPAIYNILKAFKDITGYGVLVNTSFNLRGEPIVCSPEDALHTFFQTELDVLVLENIYLFREDQIPYKKPDGRAHIDNRQPQPTNEPPDTLWDMLMGSYNSLQKNPDTTLKSSNFSPIKYWDRDRARVIQFAPNSIEMLKTQLKKHWQCNKFPETILLTETICRLAEHLKNNQVENTQVTDFSYPMF